jgi:excinuclease ABC subunit A
MLDKIVIRGARVHNLKNIDLDLPRNRLIVVTGVSGSGKSSLAFDTLYAEGQRRYVESLSAYARQFLERMDRPDVDEIKGISPAVAVEQKNPTTNSRSTVATATEIHDYLRLLYARIGRIICPQCGREVKRTQVQDAVDAVLALPAGTRVVIAFPLAGTTAEERILALAQVKSSGYYRLLIGEQQVPIEEVKVDSLRGDAPLVIVDRLKVDPEVRDRLADSLGLAFGEGKGTVVVAVDGRKQLRFTDALTCPNCDISFIEPQPRLFSFNNPFGACPTCRGFGDIIEIDLDLVVPDKSKSINEGAIEPWNTPSHQDMLEWLQMLAPRLGVDLDKPFHDLSDKELEVVLHGRGEFPGIYGFFKWLERKKYKIGVRVFLSRYRGFVRCPDCRRSRLRPEALWVKVGGKDIGEVTRMTIGEAADFFANLKLSEFEEQVARQILKEIRTRLSYLVDVGVDYLTLDRRTQTLSGGEYQRVNLATILGAKLVGALYILDEPSIGLHPRDNRRLIRVLKSLRNLGNTVLVVEHDRDMMKVSDHLVDLGPHAGERGGQVVYQGTFQEIISDGAATLTAEYLKGERTIPVPDRRRQGNGHTLRIVGAREHNLKSITVEIPLGMLVAVTGVSGSGKSTLVHDVLYTAAEKFFGRWKRRVGEHDRIEGLTHIDGVELVDQSPIGRTPRSNPATYTKAFDGIRKAFASTRRARAIGYKPGSFSFNTPGGRCDVCEGAGAVKVEMQFLADLYLTCEACGGRRYKRDVLDIRYRGRNISEVLEMTVSEALVFFSDIPNVADKLRLLDEVGLGYLRLGQPATTLSGGEAQRVKLAAHLSQKQGRHLLYIFDEPTTGLHFDDIAKLLRCFARLIDAGNSVLVIEHNLDVIKCADWVIDLGPEGGEKGGQVVAVGTPEQVAACRRSHTGRFLRQVLRPSRTAAVA